MSVRTAEVLMPRSRWSWESDMSWSVPWIRPWAPPLTTAPLLGWEMHISSHEVEHVRLHGVKFSIDGWHFPKLGFKKSPWHGTLSEHPLGPYMSHSIANIANLVAFLMQYISIMHCPPSPPLQTNAWTLLLQSYWSLKLVGLCDDQGIKTTLTLMWLRPSASIANLPVLIIPLFFSYFNKLRKLKFKDFGDWKILILIKSFLNWYF